LFFIFIYFAKRLVCPEWHEAERGRRKRPSFLSHRSACARKPQAEEVASFSLCLSRRVRRSSAADAEE